MGPTMTGEEFDEIERRVKEHEAWRQRMRDRLFGLLCLTGGVILIINGSLLGLLLILASIGAFSTSN
jgi:hypothetical protein